MMDMLLKKSLSKYRCTNTYANCSNIMQIFCKMTLKPKRSSFSPLDSVDDIFYRRVGSVSCIFKIIVCKPFLA